MSIKKSIKSEEWFESWFDSKYYHSLYQSRNDDEANDFICRLQEKLQLDKEAKILDLCCGRGRHSFMLNQLGFKHVHGVDLSLNNIKYAKSIVKPGIVFNVHDMRDVYRPNYFNVVLNLFTSFGYFEDNVNLKALQCMNSNLLQGGLLILDYFNPKHVNSNLTKSETLQINNVIYNISRDIDGDHLRKEIEIKDEDISYRYTEEVRLISIDMFKDYFDQSGFELKKLYGTYELDSFNEDSSNRMIMVAQKKALH